ncbi:hypothetical protein GGX14DRAFT_409580, partial [Mycena pura]
MEPDNPPVVYAEPTLPVQRSSDMFQNATGFAVRESQFTNVQGNMVIHQTVASPALSGPQQQQMAPNTLSSQAIVHSESGLYSNQLLRQGRGYPLYVPGPQIKLPAEYRRHGVAIGDVGTVTPQGDFDFFFNIYLPAGPPINANVPEDFVPLLCYDRIDVHNHDFDPGNYVSRSSIHEIGGRFSEAAPGGEFFFNCRGPNGAVLALPHGAHVEELRNLASMQRYAEKHAKSWYKYVNEARGRGLVNGSLYLVTAWEKAKSWGMASFHDVSLQNEFQLWFRPTADADSGYRYRWQAPYCHHKHVDSPPVYGTPLNQTTFIRAFSISLGEGIWAMLFGNVEVSQLVDSSTFMDKSSGSSVPYGPQGSSSKWSLFGGSATGGGKQCTGQTLENGIISDASPIPQVCHPSQIIHQRILREAPQATVVITHDDDWCNIFRDNFWELQETIFDGFEIMEEDGAAFLRAKSDFTPLESTDPITFDLPDRPPAMEAQNRLNQSPWKATRSTVSKRTILNNCIPKSHCRRYSKGQSHLLSWTESSVGPAHATKWNVQCKRTGIADSKTAAREEAAGQSLM